MAFDLVTQLHAQVEAIGRGIKLERFCDMAVQALQMIRQGRAKAAAQRRGRQAPQHAQFADAHAPQTLTAVFRQIRMLHRNLVERGRHRPRMQHRQAILQPGQHPRRARYRRQRDAMGKTQQGQFLAHAGLDLRPRSQQVETGFHFQQQATGPLHADLGAVAIRPGGKELLPACSVRRIVFEHGEIRHQRMRGAQSHPGAKTRFSRGGIDRMQGPQMHRAADQGQRLIPLRLPTQHPIERQLRQKYAGPEHGRSSRARRNKRLRRHWAATALAHLPADPALSHRHGLDPQCRR